VRTAFSGNGDIPAARAALHQRQIRGHPARRLRSWVELMSKTGRRRTCIAMVALKLSPCLLFDT